VRTVRAFGGELVLFRDAAGTLGALEPHCPHRGAHLGHGGRVDGSLLRCPFHGVGWDAEGRCVGEPRVRARAGAWPARDWQGQTMVFHAADRRAPDWSLPSLPSDGWSPARWRTLELRGYVQDVAENGVDLAHFAVVHRYSDVRDPVLEVDGARLHSRFSFARANPLLPRLGRVRAVFDTDLFGLGCSITDLRVAPPPLHFRLLLLATQRDAERFAFSIGLAVERPRHPAAALLLRPVERALLAALLATIEGDVLQDRDIWAHRVALARPAPLSTDEPVNRFLRWAERFYPARSAAGG
jgi:nitrite reductase/ring-hydroxylating ferredoxin subunit